MHGTCDLSTGAGEASLRITVVATFDLITLLIFPHTSPQPWTAEHSSRTKASFICGADSPVRLASLATAYQACSSLAKAAAIAKPRPELARSRTARCPAQPCSQPHAKSQKTWLLFQRLDRGPCQRPLLDEQPAQQEQLVKPKADAAADRHQLNEVTGDQIGRASASPSAH